MTSDTPVIAFRFVGASEKCLWWKFNDSAYCHSWMASNNWWLARRIIYETVVNNWASISLLRPVAQWTIGEVGHTKSLLTVHKALSFSHQSGNELTEALHTTVDGSGERIGKSIFRNSILLFSRLDSGKMWAEGRFCGEISKRFLFI